VTNEELMQKVVDEIGDSVGAAMREYVDTRILDEPGQRICVQAAVGKALVILGAVNLGRSMLLDDDELNVLRDKCIEFMHTVADLGKESKMGRLAKLISEANDAE
jgi:hypothetical protein